MSTFLVNKLGMAFWGLHSTEVAYLLLTQLTWVQITAFPPKKFKVTSISDVAEVNQQHWLEESGRWFANVDQTYLVLASGKPVLQKKFGMSLLLTTI